MVHPKGEDNHAGKGKPETEGTAEGSAKRNIQRKHSPYDQKGKTQGGGAGGKGKWNDLDDGSMTYDQATPVDDEE